MLPELIDVALGNEKADIVFKNANIVNVFMQKIQKADVAVKDGFIVGIGEYSCDNEVNLDGKYLMPSFIDAHVHVESSMLTPSGFAEIAAKKGVTDVIADPHEIVNVLGENGLKFMIEDSSNTPLDFHYMMPSCVPATAHDSSGCVIDGKETKRLFEKYKLHGLAEMMNYPGVLAKDGDVLEKLSCSEILDGHAPSVSGKDLCAYLSCGIRTDHECSSEEEALEKLSLGMYILLREGSHGRNITDLYKIINKDTMRRLCFCTDDKNLADIMDEGSISFCINKAISLGVDPICAITMATLNTAECFGLNKQGAIAPGYKANLVITKDLNAKEIEYVYKNGVCLVKNNELLFNCPKTDSSYVKNTIHAPNLQIDDFKLEFNPSMPIIEAHKDTLYTTPCFQNDLNGLNLALVIERHHNTGNVGKAYVKGFNIKDGAVAQTVGHDSHNISVVGDNPSDMKIAFDSLSKSGGIVVVKKGQIIGNFELPVAGIMTDNDPEKAKSDFLEVTEALKKVSTDAENDLFMSMAFLSLIVIPEIKLTDKGLFDVTNWKFIN